MDAVEESALNTLNGMTLGYGIDKLSRNVIKRHQTSLNHRRQGNIKRPQL